MNKEVVRGTYGRMTIRTHGRTNGPTDGWMYRWIALCGWTNGLMGGHRDIQTDNHTGI